MFYKDIEVLIEWIKRDSNYIDIASYGVRDRKFKANILFKSTETIVSGIDVAKRILDAFGLEYKFFYKNSDQIIQEKNKKIIIGQICGNAYDLLICERTILNILSLMSGVATKTYEFSENLLKTETNTRIAATRKTIPGVGFLQKLAVLHGGGDTHRWNLSECVMLKDNHIKAYGGIIESLKYAKKVASFTKKIEIEVESIEDAILATKCGADIIMLDNFKPELAKIIAKEIKKINNKVIVEVSGGIRKNTYLSYANENINIISTGILTTEIEYKDYSLDIIS